MQELSRDLRTYTPTCGDYTTLRGIDVKQKEGTAIRESYGALPDLALSSIWSINDSKIHRSIYMWQHHLC